MKKEIEIFKLEKAEACKSGKSQVRINWFERGQGEEEKTYGLIKQRSLFFLVFDNRRSLRAHSKAPT